ncbi:MAG TPA: hypothetical protein EYG51_15120 [Pseudomonadales bacterium]|nr:hypothetical protein [Pseudomonadales bacterium]
MAEQNAKNKIVDAVTPQIRRLIEAQLLGEQAEETIEDIEAADSLLAAEEFADDEIDFDAPEEISDFDADVLDLDSMLVADTDTIDAAIETTASATTSTINVSAGAGVEVDVGPDTVAIGRPDEFEIVLDLDGEEDFEDFPDEEELMLSTEGARALAKLLRKPNVIGAGQVVKRMARLMREARRFENMLKRRSFSKMNRRQRTMASNCYRKMLSEAVTLRKHAILTEVETNARGLNKRADLVLREIRKMAKRRNRGLFDRLFEAEGEPEELEELDAVLTLEPEDEDEAEEVEDLLGDLSLEFEIEAPFDVEVDVEEEEEVDIDFGAPEEEEEVIDIDEGMLRRELRRMKRLREQEEGRAAAADPALAHGGEVVFDDVLEVNEDDLINALADELGDPGVPTPKVGGAAFVESRRNRRAPRRRRPARGRRVNESRARRRPSRGRRVNESRSNRALNGKLHDYRKAVGSLRGQLDEMNLFNAKLLYVNKLMQNRNVTPKQQRVIVEALDNAKTLREAKLLYKSLTASLNKRGNLSESRVRRTLGSASKSARSAQPITEGAGSVDRWAVLAGLPDKNGK